MIRTYHPHIWQIFIHYIPDPNQIISRFLAVPVLVEGEIEETGLETEKHLRCYDRPPSFLES